MKKTEWKKQREAYSIRFKQKFKENKLRKRNKKEKSK